MKKQKRELLARALKPQLAMAVLGGIYPYVHYALDHESWVTACGPMPIVEITRYYTVLIGLLLLPVIPIAFGWSKGAGYLSIFSALGQAGLATWFILVGSVVLSCNPLIERPGDLLWLNGMFLLFFLAVFFAYMPPRIRRVINHNKDVWDFEAMRLWATGYVQRVDGRRPNMTVLALTSGFAGITIARFDLVEAFSGPAAEYWSLVLAAYALAYFMIGFLVPGTLYAAPIVHRRSRAKGEKMLVRELVQDQ